MVFDILTARILNDVRSVWKPKGVKGFVIFAPGGKSRAEIESVRQHPCNCDRSVVQVDRPSDDAAITSKVPFPKRVA